MRRRFRTGQGAGAFLGTAAFLFLISPGAVCAAAPAPKAGGAKRTRLLRKLDFKQAPCVLCKATPISCGGSAGGSLSAGDCVVDETRLDLYGFELTERKQVRIELVSEAFDTFVMLFDDACTVTAFNDDCEDLNSCLDVVLSAGRYFIGVMGFEGNATGPYELRITECSEPVCLRENCIAGALDCGKSVRGALDLNDCNRGGVYFDVYKLKLARYAQVTLKLESDRFDPVLELRDVHCELLAENDDCEDLNSCLTMQLEKGTYFVIARSFEVQSLGSYMLSVSSCECPSAAQAVEPYPPDGAESVPPDTALAWNGQGRFLAAEGSPRRKVIYGEDDRLDEFQVNDPLILTAGDATVLIAEREALADNRDGTFSLNTLSFAELYFDYEGRPLCAQEPFRAQPSVGYCTGFLVAPDIVATAGHCITNSEECSRVVFIFGYVMVDKAKAVLRFPASEVYFCSGIIARKEAAADWALVRLDRPVVDHPCLAVRRSGSVPDGQQLVVIGHPEGLPRKYAGGPKTTVRENKQPDFFQANLDAYGGNSGSPVLAWPSMQVEGILVRGLKDFVQDGECDRSHRCSDEAGCPTWEECTRSTRFERFLPRYRVLLGSRPDELEEIASGLDSPRFKPQGLEPGMTYFWRVDTLTPCGVTTGALWSFKTKLVEFVRGDANADGRLNISDAVAVLSYLFGGASSGCLRSHDANDDGKVNLADAIALLGFLFAGRPPPPAPFPDCGLDQTADSLSCLVFERCR